VTGGDLKPFCPVFDRDESEKRILLMRPSLYQWLYESDRKKTLYFKANVQAFLGRYVKGGHIENNEYMKSWRDDVFELRVQLEPKRENNRIFGAFYGPDVFIAFRRKFRFEFKTDEDWDRIIDQTSADWDSLLPGHARIKAIPFSNCITANYTDVNE
jgi:hypothetical protein